MLPGLLAAAAAAACFEGGYALQALEARTAPHDEALRASLLARLFARPRWLIGTALTLAGAGLQTLALAHAPVAVVQAVLALGLAGLLVLAHFVLREHIGVREVAAVAAVGAGVVLVAVGAPARETTIASTRALVACMAVLGVVAVAPFALRGGRARPRLSVAGAAAADGLGAIALKLLADALDQGRLPAAVGALALAGAGGGLALTAEMSALQRIAAARVGPVVVAAQVVIPAVVAALALGEPLTAGVVAGLILTVAGAAALAAVPGVLALRGEAQHDGGGGRQLAEGQVGGAA